MADKSDLVKEEFTQNYLQYRWLDDTRTKFADRFFILTAAVFLARFQFGDYLTTNWGWLLAIYLFYALISISFARTIILFRRQQRGHGRYINCLRSVLLDSLCSVLLKKLVDSPSPDLAKEYKEYIGGRKVYLTTWIEMAIALMASFSPFLLFDVLIAANVDLKGLILYFFVSTLLTVVLLYFLLLPWKRYNFNDKILWYKD